MTDTPERRESPFPKLGDKITNADWTGHHRRRADPEAQLLRIVRLLCYGAASAPHDPLPVGRASEYEISMRAPVPYADRRSQEWLLEPDEATGGRTIQVREDGRPRAESEQKAAEIAMWTDAPQVDGGSSWFDRYVHTFRCAECPLDVRIQDSGWQTGLYLVVRNLAPVVEEGEKGAPEWEAPVRVLEAPAPIPRPGERGV